MIRLKCSYAPNDFFFIIVPRRKWYVWNVTTHLMKYFFFITVPSRKWYIWDCWIFLLYCWYRYSFNQTRKERIRFTRCHTSVCWNKKSQHTTNITHACLFNTGKERTNRTLVFLIKENVILRYKLFMIYKPLDTHWGINCASFIGHLRLTEV